MERRDFRPRGGGFTPPVAVGDEFDVKIEAVGEKGDGIAKKDGFVLFVPGVSEGDEVKIKVTKVLRRVGFAEVVGKGAKTEKEEEPAAEESEESEPEEETEEEKEEEVPEDSEDFGEDLEERE